MCMPAWWGRRCIKVLKEYVIGFADPLELCSGFRVTWVLVWMCFQRELEMGSNQDIISPGT